jgi:Protein of unknown function (DUF3489)
MISPTIRLLVPATGVMNVITAADAAQRTKIMKHFTINQENNITLHASRREAKGTDGALFSTEEQFADVIGNDNQRLLEIWNSLPGVKPATKFANRKVATERIWRAIQNLGAPVVTQPAVQPTEIPPDIGSMQAAPVIQSPVAGQPNVLSQPKPQSDSATTVADPGLVVSVGAPMADVPPSAAKATKKATRTKKAPTVEPQAKATHEPSKTDTIIKMLTQPGGASLNVLMDATGWQAHSVRGFVSGTLGKKMGLTVVSAKNENGERSYSIAS